MSKLLKNISVNFTAGVLGSLAKVFFVIIVTRYSLHTFVSNSVIFSTDQPYVYKLLIHGGLWGFCFFLPLKNIFLLKGIFVSFIYSAFLLLYYFPVVTNKGIFASDYGNMAWIYIIVVNIVWGICADLFIRSSK